MNANLVLALLSKHPHLMYIELAVVTPISPSIANLSYIPKAASLPFSYLVILYLFLSILKKKYQYKTIYFCFGYQKRL
ncbi:Bgt-51856 [Blumeria graminis f. sp. tritici]|uniref:Bgt-51856 n=1 Tax=Blumeria graminis f. sp. tritici TaxID=62690 RepID=A0A9X9PQA4_BLUGR|nr:Bgt-51856 [Blumeria graminis f. sp. tritici]